MQKEQIEASDRAGHSTGPWLRPPCSRRRRLFVAAALYFLANTGVAFGQSWTRAWIIMQHVRVLVANPVTPTTLYAGLVNDSTYPYSGVFKSIDGGNTWTSSSVGLPPVGSAEASVYALVMDPTNPSI